MSGQGPSRGREQMNGVNPRILRPFLQHLNFFARQEELRTRQEVSVWSLAGALLAVLYDRMDDRSICASRPTAGSAHRDHAGVRDLRHLWIRDGKRSPLPDR